MDDLPPPRKKSRFFSGSKSITTTSSPIVAAALAHQADRSCRPGLSKLTRLQQQHLPNFTTPDSALQPQVISNQNQAQPLQCSSAFARHKQIPRYRLQLDVPAQQKPSLISPTANAFKELSVNANKDRRKAAYGAQVLLSQNEGLAGYLQHRSQTLTSESRSRIPQNGFDCGQQASDFQQANSTSARTQNGWTTLDALHGCSSPNVSTYCMSSDDPVTPFRVEKPHYLHPTSNIRQNCVTAGGPFTGFPRLYNQSTNFHHDTGPLSYPLLQSSTPVPVLNTPPNCQLFLPRPQQAVNPERQPAARGLPNTSHYPPSNLSATTVTNLPLHATSTPRKPNFKRSSAPPTHFTSPNRIQRAFSSAHTARKRKRPTLWDLPPPSYIYTRTNSSHFNIFHGILLYPELCFHLSAHLPLNDLISLYSISRDFHIIIDTRFTTVILSQSLRRAPESSRVFPFRSYLHLCRVDPSARIPHPDPAKASQGVARMVPSFRWLKMVLYREKVVHEIMTIMAEDGVPLPRRCGLALKKMWFVMDIPDNARRIGYIHNRNLVSDLDLYFIVCVIVKMDMRFNDPVGAEKRDGVRRLVLAQRSLSVWLKVLRREMWMNKLEVLGEWMRWKYDPLPNEVERGEPIFGVPVEELGRLKNEYWGSRSMDHLAKTDARGNRVLLMRPDQLVQREVVRRGLRCTRHYLRCLMYGYVDPGTLEDFEPRKVTRQISEWRGEEYEVHGDGDISAGQKLEVEEGGDPLLDLGPKKVVSVYCVRPSGVSREEEHRRRQLDEMVERMVRVWETREDGNENGWP